MKKIIVSALVSLMTLVSFAAVGSNVTTEERTSEFKSSVMVKVAGIDKEFNFKTATLDTIFGLMPDDFKDLCIDSYKHVSSLIEKSNGKSLSYEGVRITPRRTSTGAIDLEFDYKGNKLTVKNYTRSEFNKFFGL